MFRVRKCIYQTVQTSEHYYYLRDAIQKVKFASVQRRKFVRHLVINPSKNTVMIRALESNFSTNIDYVNKENRLSQKLDGIYYYYVR